MRRSDIYSGIALTIIALLMIFIIIPENISISDEFGANPKVFPLTVMWLGAAVSAILVAVRLRQSSGVADDEPVDMRPENWIFIIAMSAFLAATYLVVDAVGFRIAMPVALAVLMAVMGEYKHPVRLGIVAVTVPLAVYYSFDRLFAIQLP